MYRNYFVALALLAPFVAVARPGCHVDRILSIDSSGRLMRIGAGWRLLVYPGQNNVSVTWETGDKVQVCLAGGSGVRVTDLSQRGGKVDALRQY